MQYMLQSESRSDFLVQVKALVWPGILAKDTSNPRGVSLDANKQKVWDVA